jgi:hypothetical protein
VQGRSFGILARMVVAFFGACWLQVRWTLCRKVAPTSLHKPSRLPRQPFAPMRTTGANPLLKDARRQDPEATCALVPSNVNRNVMMNRDAAPFDKPELRRRGGADHRSQGICRHLDRGQGRFGGAMVPPPEGVWGMPADMLKNLPGYDPNLAKNRAEARGIMEQLGYGPDKRLKLTVSTRNIPPYRDPAIILIDQLKEIYIDGELDPIDTAHGSRRSCAAITRSPLT